ncbi:hypothetical protein HMPREF9519_02876, partial [Enterococcus faecalis TX1346]
YFTQDYGLDSNMCLLVYFMKNSKLSKFIWLRNKTIGEKNEIFF